MIRYIKGDIFKSPAQVLVNTVNTVGVMGKGIALEFKKRYPDMFDAYRDVCDKRQLKVGSLMLYYEPDHWVLLFPTKEHWRRPSQIDYIEKGLQKFRDTYAEKEIASIAFPRLGCGNGELSWSDVRPLMEKYLSDLPIDVYIYLGTGRNSIPEHKNQGNFIKWLRENAKDMSFQGLEDDIRYNYSMVPYDFSSGDTDWSVSWSDGLLFKNHDAENNQIQVDEAEFFKIWSDVRSECIVMRQKVDSPGRLVLDFLLSLGYVSEVKIVVNREGDTEDGYQINSGRGRVFALKEKAVV
mgnify:FL=1